MLEDPLFNFVGTRPGSRPSVPWTCGDAFQGTQILGGPGSGKTSTSGRRIAVALLRYRREDPAARFGGLVLTAKDDEVSRWGAPAHRDGEPAYAGAAGRDRLELTAFGPRTHLYRRFGFRQPDRPVGFNFLEYERQLYRGMGFPATPNLVSTLMVALSGGQDRASGSDPYWEEAVRQLTTNAIDLVELSDEPMTLDLVSEVVATAPQSLADLRTPAWRDRCCASLLRRAAARSDLDAGRESDLLATIAYWTREFPALADRTRSIIVSSFTSRTSVLLRAPFREMFCGGTNVTPEDTHAGRIVILDLPIKVFGEAGRFAQVLFKTVWQKATEWRSISVRPNPVFLWVDESQYFATSHDVAFQQTARGSRAATVYLTQSLPNYYARLGSAAGRDRTDSLLGCLQTKIMHANSDVVTNEWAERLFGYVQAFRPSVPSAQGEPVYQPTRLPRVPAHEFATLRTAGPRQPAEAFVFVLGKDWKQEGALAWKEQFSRLPEQEPGVYP